MQLSTIIMYAATMMALVVGNGPEVVHGRHLRVLTEDPAKVAIGEALSFTSHETRESEPASSDSQDGDDEADSLPGDDGDDDDNDTAGEAQSQNDKPAVEPSGTPSSIGDSAAAAKDIDSISDAAKQRDPESFGLKTKSPAPLPTPTPSQTWKTIGDSPAAAKPITKTPAPDNGSPIQRST